MAKGGKEEAVVWYSERRYAIIIGLVSLVVAYFTGSAALNSGSWWEYLLTLIFIALAFNRFIAAIKNE